MDKLMPVFCNRYQWYADVGNFREITFQVPIFCSIRWIVEKLKNQKTKMLSFYKQQSYFSQIVSKKPK